MSMDENGNVVFLASTDFDPMEIQPQNEYSVSTSRNSMNSGANAFGSDHCLGLPCQDHNYGAQPPSVSKSGRQRVNSHTFNPSGTSTQYQGPAAHQPISKQAILQQHQGNQVTIRGQIFTPPALDRNTGGYLDDETSAAVDFLSPTNFGGDQHDRSPPFYQTGGFSASSMSRFSTFRPDGDIEVATSTSASTPSVNLLGDFQMRFGAATSRGARPSLVSSTPTSLTFDGESHSYCVPRNVNGTVSSASLLSGPPPRAPRVPRRPRVAFQGPQDGQQMYAASTPTPYGANFASAHARMYPNIVEQHLISPESLTTIQSLYPDRQSVGSDIVLSSVLSSPPPNFDAFPSNIESAPYQPNSYQSSAPSWSRSRTPGRSSASVNFGVPAGTSRTSTFSGRRAIDASLSSNHKNLPAALRAAGFTDSDVIIPIELPDDPTASSASEPMVGAVATVDVVDSATSPTVVAATTTMTVPPPSEVLMTPSAVTTEQQGGDVKKIDKSQADSNTTSEKSMLNRLFGKLGVDVERSKKITQKRSRSRPTSGKKVFRRTTDKAPSEPAVEVIKSPTVTVDQQEQSNTDTDDEEGESDEKALDAGETCIKPRTSSENGPLNDQKGGVSESDSDSLKSEQTSSDEWAGQDYTTRCLCDMTHNDEFMIQCDKCEFGNIAIVWD